MMKELLALLREGLPEAIGGLIAVGVLALIGALYTKVGKRVAVSGAVATTVMALVVTILLYTGIDVWTAVLGVVGFAATLGCAYVASKTRYPKRRQSRKKTTKQQWSWKRLAWGSWAICGKGPWHYPKWRPWAFVGLVAIPLLVASAIGYRQYIIAHTPNTFRVLVAEFDGPDPQKYRVTETILVRLRQALEPYEHTKVESLQQAITEAEGSDVARAKGESREASIVIWGWYGVTAEIVPLSINFEILCPLRCSPALRSEVQGEIQQLPSTELESFTLQSELSDEMALLSLLVVGLVEFSTEDWDKAIASFDNALSQVEQHVSARDVYYYRGMAYLHKRNYDKALDDFSRAIEIAPNFAIAYGARAGAFFARGDIDGAITEASEAITRAPDDATLYHNRGIFYMEGKKDYDQAIVDLSRAVKLGPDDPSNYKDRGMAYYWNGDYDLALTDLNHAISLFQQESKQRSDSDFKEEFARAYVYLGTIYGERDDNRRALAALNRAIRLKPDYANAYQIRSVMLVHKSNYDRAIADLSKAMELSNDPDRLEDMERDLALLTAFVSYDQAIKRNPGLADAYVGRGHTYGKMGKYDQAITDLNFAIKLDPNLIAAYGYRGLAYRELKDYDRAIADFSQVIRLVPDDALAYFERGITYNLRDDYDLAISDFDEVIKCHPDDAASYFNRGLAYRDKGDHNRAIADFKTALELSNDPDQRKRTKQELEALELDK